MQHHVYASIDFLTTEVAVYCVDASGDVIILNRHGKRHFQKDQASLLLDLIKKEGHSRFCTTTDTQNLDKVLNAEFAKIHKDLH